MGDQRAFAARETRLDMCAFWRVQGSGVVCPEHTEGEPCSMSHCVGLGSGRSVVSKAAWARIKTHFISPTVDRGGF